MFGYAAEFKPGVVQRGVLEYALLCNDQLTRPKDNKQQQNLPVCCILTTDVSFCHLLQQTLELPTFFKLPFCRLQSLRCTIP